MISRQFDIFLFDLDGVIYVGPEALPEACSSLGRLRAMGKHIRFLTNDPGPTRQQLVQRLRGLGIEVQEDEVISSCRATALYLQRQGIRRVYAVGSPGMCQELEACDVACIEQGQPEASVVGSDDNVTFGQIRQAAFFIHQGAQFIATNADLTYPTPQGRSPATGTITEAIRVATEVAPVIIGKPFPAMFTSALQGLDPRLRAIMIGDTPTADILGAHRYGLPALLISAGVPMYPTKRDPLEADACIPDLSYLFRDDIILPQEVIDADCTL